MARCRTLYAHTPQCRCRLVAALSVTRRLDRAIAQPPARPPSLLLRLRASAPQALRACRRTLSKWRPALADRRLLEQAQGLLLDANAKVPLGLRAGVPVQVDPRIVRLAADAVAWDRIEQSDQRRAAGAAEGHDQQRRELHQRRALGRLGRGAMLVRRATTRAVQ